MSLDPLAAAIDPLALPARAVSISLLCLAASAEKSGEPRPRRDEDDRVCG
jgi:hypothetical protein